MRKREREEREKNKRRQRDTKEWVWFLFRGGKRRRRARRKKKPEFITAEGERGEKRSTQQNAETPPRRAFSPLRLSPPRAFAERGDKNQNRGGEKKKKTRETCHGIVPAQATPETLVKGHSTTRPESAPPSDREVAREAGAWACSVAPRSYVERHTQVGDVRRVISNSGALLGVLAVRT